MLARLLRWLTDDAVADSILGDLHEERARRRRSSSWRAALWYWLAITGVLLHAGKRAMGESLPSARAGLDWRTVGGEAKQAGRMLLRAPAGTIVIVATLALGLGLNTAIFSLVHGVLFEPLPFDRPENLVFVQGTRRGEPPSVFGTSYPDYLDVARDQQSFNGLATSCYWTFTVTGTEVPLRLVGQRVSGSFFPLLNMRPLHGRWINEADDQRGGPEVVVISHGLWEQIFGGDPGIIGRPLMLNGRSAEVVGIMPAAFAFPFEDVQLWAPMLGEMDTVPRNSRFFSTIGRLRHGVTRAAAQHELERLAAGLEQMYPATNRDWRPVVADALPAITASARPRLMLLFTAVLVVLLVAAVNVAALIVSRTAARRQELGIRVALGAGRARLARVLLFESAWLGIAGLGAGMALAIPSLAILRTIAPDNLPRLSNITISWPVAIWAAGAMAIVVCAGTIAPLLAVRSFTITGSGGTRVTGASRGRAHRILVIAQVAGAFTLLIAGGLLVRSFTRVLDVDPGFNTANLITLRVFLTPPTYRTIDQQIGFVTRALETLAASPAVNSVAAVSQPPFDAEGSGSTLAVAVEGQTYATGTNPVVAYRGVSPGYFSTMELPILEGRAITDDDRRGSPLVAVINRAMADRLWPGTSPLGRRFEFADGRNAGWHTVVGVSGDVATDGLETGESPAVYAPFVQRTLPFLRWMTFIVRTNGDADAAMPTVRRRLQEIDSQQPIYAVTTMETTIARSMSERRFAVALMTVFAGLALLLAALGVYGMLAQRVASRTREIGVRLALGAVPRQVFRLVIREGAIQVAAGMLIGAVLVALGAPLIETSLFGVTATDSATYSASGIVLATVTLLASAVPALTAARTDPITTLRRE